MPDIVSVEGLAQVQRSLKKLGEFEASKELQAGLKVAAEIVAMDARRRVPSRTGGAVGSIRTGVTVRAAYVAGGKKSVPYYGWLDFGSRTPKKGNPRSKGPWAGTGKGPKSGRFIYPALDAKRDQVVAAVRDALIKLEDWSGLQ
jgi:hypothetical protein